MFKIELNNNPYQSFTLPFEGDSIRMEIRYYPVKTFWTLSVSYGDKEVKGVKLSGGVLSLGSNNLPFDLFVISDLDIDPYKVGDFISRCSLYLLEKSEVEKYRGVSLP